MSRLRHRLVRQKESSSAGPAQARSAVATPFLIRSLQKRLAGREVGVFDLELPDGSTHRVGGEEGSPSFSLRLRSSAAVRALASLDEAAIADAYMNGAIDFEGDFLAALDLRTFLSDSHPLRSVWRFLQPLLFGKNQSDKRWVTQHYDYGDDFYFSFLDRQARLYSQALFRSEDDTLEQAAQNKLEYIIRACRLPTGSHVLDVGAGWASFAEYAGARGINVSMLTISRAQYDYLVRRCATNTLSCTMEVIYESIFAYTSVRQYDAIVLSGVMEHLPDYRALFSKFDQLLKVNGRLYMDFAASRRKFAVSSFTYRHIFPGAHSPVVLPSLLAAANRTRFELISLQNDRHSYFLTLQGWARNLEAAHDVVTQRFSERTFRLFQMYLWGGAHQLQRDGTLESYRLVFQKSLGSPSSDIGLEQ